MSFYRSVYKESAEARQFMKPSKTVDSSDYHPDQILGFYH